MMKNAEKISKPTASFSLNPKQMQGIRFAPRSVELTEPEHETSEYRGAPRFSYNLMNIPAYPPVQRKEPEDEELQMKPSESCHECEEEEIQAKPADNRITPILQRQQNPESEDEEILQGKFLPIQRKEPYFNYNLLNVPAYPPVQRKQPEEEEELLQGKMAEIVQRQPDPDEEELMQGKFASGLTGTLQTKKEAPPNKTGMPDRLKFGIENLSGIDISGMRVHYNSPKPARLNAFAYTQNQEIHVAPGQEQHLPHEAWHAVQQAQGRVQPTMRLKCGVPINNDEVMEHEADTMGRWASTSGQDMFFRRGAYQPRNRVGLELIAPELIHVAQQNGGVLMQSPQTELFSASATGPSPMLVVQRMKIDPADENFPENIKVVLREILDDWENGEKDTNKWSEASREQLKEALLKEGKVELAEKIYNDLKSQQEEEEKAAAGNAVPVKPSAPDTELESLPREIAKDPNYATTGVIYNGHYYTHIVFTKNAGDKEDEIDVKNLPAVNRVVRRARGEDRNDVIDFIVEKYQNLAEKKYEPCKEIIKDLNYTTTGVIYNDHYYAHIAFTKSENDQGAMVDLKHLISVNQIILRALEVNRVDVVNLIIGTYQQLTGKIYKPTQKQETYAGERAKAQIPGYKSTFDAATPKERPPHWPIAPTDDILVDESTLKTFIEYGEPGHAFTGLVRFEERDPRTEQPIKPVIYLHPTQSKGTYLESGVKPHLPGPNDPGEHAVWVQEGRELPPILDNAKVQGKKPGYYSTHAGSAMPSHKKLQDMTDTKTGLGLGFTVIRGGKGTEHKYSFVSRSSNNELFTTLSPKEKGKTPADKKTLREKRGIEKHYEAFDTPPIDWIRAIIKSVNNAAKI